MPYIIMLFIGTLFLIVSFAYILDGQMELPKWRVWKDYKPEYKAKIIFWDLVSSGFSILLPFVIIGIPAAWLYFSHNALEPVKVVDAKIVNETYDGKIKYQYAEYKIKDEVKSELIKNNAIKYFQYDNKNYKVKVKVYDDTAYGIWWMKINKIIIKKRSEYEN